jgi:hypothetical protein
MTDSFSPIDETDEFILVRLAKDSDDAVVHFKGDLDTLIELLAIAQAAVMGEGRRFIENGKPEFLLIYPFELSSNP